MGMTIASFAAATRTMCVPFPTWGNRERFGKQSFGELKLPTLKPRESQLDYPQIVSILHLNFRSSQYASQRTPRCAS